MNLSRFFPPKSCPTARTSIVMEGAPPCSWSRLRTITIGLDPIAVRIDDKGGVVAGVLVLTQTRFAIVAPARLQGRRVKGLDTLAGGCRETKMQPGLAIGGNRSFRGTDPECDRALPIAEGTL